MCLFKEMMRNEIFCNYLSIVGEENVFTGSTYINVWIENIFPIPIPQKDTGCLKSEPGEYWFFSQNGINSMAFLGHPISIFSYKCGSTYINWWMKHIFPIPIPWKDTSRLAVNVENIEFSAKMTQILWNFLDTL